MIDLSLYKKSETYSVLGPKGETVVMDEEDYGLLSYIRFCIARDELEGYFLSFCGMIYEIDKSGEILPVEPKELNHVWFDYDVERFKILEKRKVEQTQI